MAIIHKTTMSPSKLDLLTAWLPGQPWYRTNGGVPELTRAGGFRLDDPAGQVGIEFLVVTDGTGESAASYLVPLTYRGQPLAGADGGLVGTAEHGVLGQRWVYDGLTDPVLVAELVALIQGDAHAQAQSVSNTPDPSVLSSPLATEPLVVTGSGVAASGPAGSDLLVSVTAADGARHGELALRVHRLLRPGDTAGAAAGSPCLRAGWRLPGGAQVSGILITGKDAELAGRPPGTTGP